MRIAERIGPALERLRRERGLTQGEVERQAGLTPRSLTKYEKPRASYSWSSIEKILQALDANLLDLHFAITGERPESAPSDTSPVAATVDDRRETRRLAIEALKWLANGGEDEFSAGPQGGRVNRQTAPARREGLSVADRDRGDDSRDR